MKNCCSSSAAISPTTAASSSGSIGSKLREMRSVTCSRCGLAYVPTDSWWAASSAVTMRAVEPLPLVPVMWMTG